MTDLTVPTETWPALRVDDWIETRETLHMWTQIIGKVRMAHAPLLNHWWQVTLYVTPRGLSTSSVPHGPEAFDIEFDFIDHVLRIRTSLGATREFPLEGQSVASFYAATMGALDDLGFQTRISATPNEVDPAIPFAEDTTHKTYDPNAAHLFWRQLLQANRLMSEFRSRFTGKVSPVHFFWGSFDLAVTRFSGRNAPKHPGGAPNCGDWVMVEGYSRELSSCGFWPGGGEEGAFYAYSYPQPDTFKDWPVEPKGDAFWSDQYVQFLLPYEKVRTAADPDKAVLDFLQSTYEGEAEIAHWDRQSLELDAQPLLPHIKHYARFGK